MTRRKTCAIKCAFPTAAVGIAGLYASPAFSIPMAIATDTICMRHCMQKKR